MSSYFRFTKFSNAFLAASSVVTCAHQQNVGVPAVNNPPANLFGGTTPRDFTVRQWMFPMLNAFLDQYMQDNDIKGLSVAVSKSGDLKYVFGRGIQDHNLDIQSTTDMVSSVSCISKVFLAYMLLKLKENFQVAFNTNMQDYIDNFPLNRVANRIGPAYNGLQPRIPQDSKHPIYHPGHMDESRYEYDTIAEMDAVENEETIYYTEGEIPYPQNILNLLHEKSGLKPYHLWSEKNPQAYKGTLEQYVRELVRFPNRLTPGRWRYDENVSYEFLAYLIEKVTGRNYKDVVHEELLRLGLRDTKILSQEELYLNKNRGSQSKDPTKNATFVDYSSKLGAEGLCSTVKDLDKLFNILFVCLATPPVREAELPLAQHSMRAMLRVDNAQFNANLVPQATNLLGTIYRNKGMAITIDCKEISSHLGTKWLALWAQGNAMESSSISMVTTEVDKYISEFDTYRNVPASVNTGLVDQVKARDNNMHNIPFDCLQFSRRIGRVTTLPPPSAPPRPPSHLYHGDESLNTRPVSPKPAPRPRDVPPVPVGIVLNPDRRMEFFQESENQEHVLEDYDPFENELLLRNTDLNFNWKYITVSIICADRDKDLYNLACRISRMFKDEYF